MSRRLSVNLVLLTGSVICAGLAGLSFETVKHSLDRVVDDGSADFFTADVHRRFRIVAVLYGAIFLGGAVTGFRRSTRAKQSAAGTVRTSPSGLRLPRFDRRFWLAVLVCSLIAAAVRLVHLDQPMRYDEAYTYNTYISRGLFAALSTYESPNNHLLNTFCSWGAVKAFGNSPASLRLPALLAGILCVSASMLLAYRIAGNRAAILAGTLVAFSSPLIEYSTNARGYTLLGLWTILAWLGSLELIRRDHRAARWTLALAIGFGLATIPLMLLPLLMLGSWVGCLWWKSRDRAGIAHRFGGGLLAGGLLASVAYSPILVMIGPSELLANAAGRNLGSQSPADPVYVSLERAGALLFRDLPWPILVLMCLGIMAFVWRLTPKFWFGRVAAVVSACACFIPLLLLDTAPPARAWLFLLPLLFVACGCGGVWCLELLETRIARNLATCGLVAIAAVWPFANATVRGSIENSPETGAFPEAERILNDLRPVLTPADRIYAVGPAHPQLVYYAERMGIDRRQFPNLDEQGIPSGSLLICPNTRDGSVDDCLSLLGPNPVRGVLTPLRSYPKTTIFRVNYAHKVGKFSD